MQFEELLETIQRFDIITLYRHGNPDCDAVGSQFGFREWLRLNFPEKKVYALGKERCSQGDFPDNDVIDDETVRKSLAIVLDTANQDRVDDQRFAEAAMIVKIDHHPNYDPFGAKRYVFEEAAAVCEILPEFFQQTGLQMNQTIAEYLYKGLLTDTLCFRTSNTRPHTLEMASYLSSFGISIPEINRELFDLSLNDFRFGSYIRESAKIINDTVACVILSQEDLKKWNKTPGNARNFIDELGHVREFQIWAIFTENKEHLYDGSLRSKRVRINDIAQNYHGGGHKNASGVKNLTKEDIDSILTDFQNRLKEA